jgi:hypothetical protein
MALTELLKTSREDGENEPRCSVRTRRCSSSHDSPGRRIETKPIRYEFT